MVKIRRPQAGRNEMPARERSSLFSKSEILTVIQEESDRGLNRGITDNRWKSRLPSLDVLERK
ncbi:hypothetical protein GF318_03205 [Candidatus Micrarchaeota archaeon]|nr:hypothetical protein [Candidatus Micrarchaeota archaeon]